MPQNPLERWRPPNVYYADLVNRARELDPKSVVAGAASPGEIARMEKLVDRLEKEAAAKEAAKRAAAQQSIEPLGIANGGLYELWHRAHRARMKIAEAQAKLGSNPHGSFSLRHDLADLKMLNPPPECFETPPDIGGGPPCAGTLEKADLLAANLSVVAEKNARAVTGLREMCAWAEAGMEQQNRRLIRTLFERLRLLEEAK